MPAELLFIYKKILLDKIFEEYLKCQGQDSQPSLISCVTLGKGFKFP